MTRCDGCGGALVCPDCSEHEIDRLRAWKAEALIVLNEWDEVWKLLGKPGSLGQTKARGVHDMVRIMTATSAS